MTRKIKTTLLTGLLFFGLLTGLKAQDKYEYATITYLPINRDLQTSINGVDFEKIIVPKEKVKGDFDTNAALEKVKIMTEQGWELINTSSSSVVNYRYQFYIFFLRKKQ